MNRKSVPAVELIGSAETTTGDMSDISAALFRCPPSIVATRWGGGPRGSIPGGFDGEIRSRVGYRRGPANLWSAPPPRGRAGIRV